MKEKPNILSKSCSYKDSGMWVSPTRNSVNQFSSSDSGKSFDIRYSLFDILRFSFKGLA